MLVTCPGPMVLLVFQTRSVALLLHHHRSVERDQRITRFDPWGVAWPSAAAGRSAVEPPPPQVQWLAESMTASMVDAQE